MFDLAKVAGITNGIILVVEILILFGFTIFVHELGHFIAAKRMGVKVEKFSIGFGPKVFSFTRNGTEYIISFFAFLGGYVKMAGEAPEEAETAGNEGFLNQPIWKKMLISVSGVVQNAVFAVLLMWIVMMAGTEVMKPTVEQVIKGGPAYEAGVKSGDDIVNINGKKIVQWNQISDTLAEAKGNSVSVTVLREGKEIVLTIKPEMMEREDILKEKKLRPTLGIIAMQYLPVVESVKEGSPLQAAGVKKGDRIVEIGGKKIVIWDDIGMAVEASAGKPVKMIVARGTETKIIEITPHRETMEDKDKKKRETFTIGIVPRINTIIEKYGPITAIGKAFQMTWYYTELTGRSLYKMVIRKIEPDVAGPIGVVQIAYKVAEIGFVPLLLFIAIININLVIFNLLPLLPFDGGMLLLFLIEGVTGKKVPLKVQQVMMEIGWGMLILLIVFVTYSDIMRMVRGG